MYPYYMREVSEPRKNQLEMVAAVAAIVLLLACTMSNVSRPNQGAAAAQAAQTREQDRQAIAELQTTTHQLQTRNETVEAQVAKIARLLESAQSDVAKLAERHDKLSTQVTTTAAKMQQLEATVQQATERAANSVDTGALRKIAKERDDALAQAKERGDQVRQLTLALQKAGVYP
jgi:predicted nuclease with TOPRIM domain